MDNRMGWCRNIDRLKNNDCREHIFDYEIASDSHITGVLDYQNGKILCGPLTIYMDSNGLYKYLLRIKLAAQESFSPNLIASQKGYAFQRGIPGELISIFSLYFQCRFFLLAAYYSDLTPTGIKVKTEYPMHFRNCRPYFDPSLYPDGKRNFGLGLKDFLDQLYRMDAKYHQQVVLACLHYSRALREFGIDEEMVFIRLVSAIEAVSGLIKLDRIDDLFNGLEFNGIVKLDLLSNAEKNELRSLFANRRSQLRFKRFIEHHSKGFFRGGNFKAPHTRIKKSDLSITLDAIYRSRSDYLHKGESMFLSHPIQGIDNWDTDVAVEMIIDNRRFTKRKKLPYSSFFQRLVRYCLIAFIRELSG